MSTVSMNMLKYIYAKDDFRYYNALCIAENVEDNLSKFNSILESLGEVSVKAKANSTFVCNIIDT